MVLLPNIGLFDIGLSLVYLVIIYFFAFLYQQKKKETNPEYKYFLIGLSAKVVGSISFVLISLYYYQKGDTFLYFQIAEDLRTYLFIDFKETIGTFLTSYANLDNVNFNPLERYNYYYERTSNWDFGRLVFLFNIISFGSYLVSSILIGVVSFLGLWLGYTTMCGLYQKATKLFLIPFFLIPTALIWSSGILKDTIVMGAIGVLLYTFYNVCSLKRNVLINLFITYISLLFLLLFRPVLLFVYTPCIVIWGLIYALKNIVSLQKKIILITTVLIFAFSFGYLISGNVLDSKPKYQIENLLQTLEGYQTQHPDHTLAKSAYSLGDMDYTILGVLKKVPKAINVTLFRPYIWEVNSFPMLISAIESILFFIVFFFFLFSFRKKSLGFFFSNKELLIFFSFAIIYSIITGLSACSFGALARFKIPITLFMILGIVIFFDKVIFFEKKG